MTFINCSNHPISKWSQSQLEAASELGYGEVRDLEGGFPRVDPEATSELVARQADELVARIRTAGAKAVHLKAYMCHRKVPIINSANRRLKPVGALCDNIVDTAPYLKLV